MYVCIVSSSLISQEVPFVLFSKKVMGKESAMPAGERLEWRVNMPDGTSRVLVSESSQRWKFYDIVWGFVLRIWSFIDKALQLGKKEPRKVIHGLKVGLALSLVSLFYYVRPLYDDVGGNAMWAVMTVVVVLEYTVGATLSKCVNRTLATFLAGSLGIGVHWIASQSGKKFQPIILQASVFLLAAAATFSRFIPSIKARFDYGCTIFILTFSLVSVSGYRVDKLLEMAQQRLSTIALGTSICIFIAMVLSPVWAGDDLHRLITNNLEKLADSLEGCISEYLDDDENAENSNDTASDKKLQGYKCVLNTKASEESMVNFAVWEPGHGRFNFRHPWKQYLKIGASMRACAYCIETLYGSINSSTQVRSPEYILKPVSEECSSVCSTSAKVLRDLASVMKSTKMSSIQDILVHDMNSAVDALQFAFKILPSQSITTAQVEAQQPSTMKQEETKSEAKYEHNNNTHGDDDVVPLMEIAQLSALTSLLVEIAARIEGIVKEVNQLANLAGFRGQSNKRMANKQSQSQHKEQIVRTH